MRKIRSTWKEELGDVLLQVVFHASHGGGGSCSPLMTGVDGVAKWCSATPMSLSTVRAERTQSRLWTPGTLRKPGGEAQRPPPRTPLEAVARSPRPDPGRRRVRARPPRPADWPDREPALDKLAEEGGRVSPCRLQGRETRREGTGRPALCRSEGRGGSLGLDSESRPSPKTCDKFIRRFGRWEELAPRSEGVLPGGSWRPFGPRLSHIRRLRLKSWCVRPGFR